MTDRLNPSDQTTNGHVPAHQGDDLERHGLALLAEFHGRLTLSQERRQRSLRPFYGLAPCDRVGETGSAAHDNFWLYRHFARRPERRESNPWASRIPTT